MAKIIIVDDDVVLGGEINRWLQFKRHEVEYVSDGLEGANRLLLSTFQLAILDWNLPGKSGIEICRELRERNNSTPVLMLTGKADIRDKELGYESGADDYLTKPFNMRELTLRVDALLRRPSQYLPKILQVKDLMLNSLTYEVMKAGHPVHLEPKEFALLQLLMQHPMHVFSPEALLERVWNSSSETSPDTVRTHIKNLRRKLGDDKESGWIKTVHRVGYCLQAPD